MTRKRREAIRKAENLVSRGKIEAAVRQYEKVLRADTSDTSTLNRVGDLYVRLKRIGEATELFRRAGEHFSREGFYVKAIAIFKKIIRLDPTRIDVYETLADLYHRQGLINEARTQYQVVADYYNQNGETAKVVKISERMVELEPDHPTLRVRLAELYCDVGRTSDAMQQYREIATFMMAHGKVDDAVRVYRGAVDLDPADQAYLTDAVLHLKDEGYPEAAGDLLAHGVERNPDAAGIAVLTGLARRPAATQEPESSPADDGLPEVEVDPDVDLEETLDLELDEDRDLEAPVEAPPVPASRREPVPEPSEDDRTAVGAAPSERESKEAPAAGDAVGEESIGDESEAAQPTVFLDLEADDSIPYAVQRGAESSDTEDTGEIELDLAEIEPASPAVAPTVETGVGGEPRSSRADELFHEARVLANYGLESKAADLLAEALESAPSHFEALALAARVDAGLERNEEAATRASACAALAAGPDEERRWEELAGFLTERGFAIAGTAVTPPSTRPRTDDDRAPAEAREPAAVAEEPPGAAGEGPDWLEDSASDTSEEGAAELFGQENDFFDLAGELEEELRREDLLDEGFDPQPAEQSLEEIVEGFRKGVADTLAAEDYDTHYNLGIAYREMGLVDEAIGEFQLAAKDGRYLVDCCSLLGSCFLEKGFPDLAIKWYERGLESPGISEKESLGLLYELGNLYVTTGETEEALATFTEIYGTNSNYRDVVARLAELGGDA